MSPTTTAISPTVTPEVALDGYDPVTLAALMVDLINRDRAAAGLPSVAWDPTAAAVAAAHAEDMVGRGFFSHWNPDGLGPDHRYALAGGEHSAHENLHALDYSGGVIAVVDWPAVIEDAQAGFMNSPGHRANVLDPAHTHVGIGMAWAADGRFRLAQEFTNQYVQLSAALPAAAHPGEVLRVAGEFGAGAAGHALLDVAYEPFPAPLTAGELAARATYTSAAQSIETRAIGLTFDETVVLPAGPPGLYHVRLFVDLASGQALVVDRVVRVE